MFDNVSFQNLLEIYAQNYARANYFLTRFGEEHHEYRQAHEIGEACKSELIRRFYNR